MTNGKPASYLSSAKWNSHKHERYQAHTTQADALKHCIKITVIKHKEK